MVAQREKAERFKALHEREGAFVIPNPWDVGSARLLAGLGFDALATTSAGFANSAGRLDGQAFEAAGADVLYAPGLTTLEEVRLMAGALTKPVNVLAPLLNGVTVAELAEAGAKRISTGGALARAALTALLRAGTEMHTQGSFGWASGLAPSADVQRWPGAQT